MANNIAPAAIMLEPIMLFKLPIMLCSNAPKILPQIMLHKMTLRSQYLSSYCNLITCTSIIYLWISVVFIITLQHEVSCTKETMSKTLKLFLATPNIVLAIEELHKVLNLRVSFNHDNG